MLRYFILILLFPMVAYGDNKFQFFTIGTGGITGVYYSAGNAICKLVNKNFIQHKMRCAVETTAGSAFNVKAVRNEDVVFGLVQAGVHYNSYNGVATFASESPYRSMRSLFSLHDEVFTLIANPALNIKTVEELAQKRVAIGPVGSGTRIGAKQLLSLAGYKDSDFAVLSDMKVDQTISALCANTIDAYIYIVGQPARNTKESTGRCQGVLLSITGAAAKGLDDIPYFSKYRIPGGLYECAKQS